MMVGFFRTIRFSAQNVWRNLWLSLITIFLMVLTTMSITLVAGLNIIGQQIITVIQDKVDIDLYFYDYVREDDILKTQEYVQSIAGVSGVVYVSQEDALKKFRDDHKDEPNILASLDELDKNVLPASLTIRAENIEAYPSIIETFQSSEYQKFIDHTDYSDNKEVINSITQMTRRAYTIGLGVSLIFVAISVIVIFNTIRITIYSHREEVAIMKLVGATNWFVRGPFILESILLGLISAVLTLILFCGLLYVSDSTVTAFFAGYDFSIYAYFIDHVFEIALFEIGGAIVLSTVSSMIAMNRYLKI